MRKPLLCCLFSLTLAAPALAQNEGESCTLPDPNTGEGGSPLVCSGNDLLVCRDGQDGQQGPAYAKALNCQTDLANVGGGTCQTVQGIGDTCAMNTGAQCVFFTEQGTLNFPCAGAGEGCGFTPDKGQYTCLANAGTCTPGENFAASCVGNKAVWGCNGAGQPIFDDCTAIGGTCQNGLGCINITEGNICDGEDGQFNGQQGPFWTCASGLICQGLSQESYGTCTGGGNNDNTGGGNNNNNNNTGDGNNDGNRNDRDRDDEEEPPPPNAGCSSVNGAAMPVLALFGLLGLARVRRRR